MILQSDGRCFCWKFSTFITDPDVTYAPTVFGETDSTSGVWVPKTAPSVTYGTNGFS